MGTLVRNRLAQDVVRQRGRGNAQVPNNGRVMTRAQQLMTRRYYNTRWPLHQ